VNYFGKLISLRNKRVNLNKKYKIQLKIQNKFKFKQINVYIIRKIMRYILL